jgi:mono/diheme cytochrome c family protein
MSRLFIRGLFGLIAAFGVAVVSVGAQGNPEAAKMKNPVPATAASVKAGEALYTKNCSFCHGPKGLGDGKLAPAGSKPANLTDAAWDNGGTDGEIHALILTGTTAKGGKMPGVKARMSDTDVWNIVNYLRSIGPKR